MTNITDRFIADLVYEIEDFRRIYEPDQFIQDYMGFQDHEDYIEQTSIDVATNLDEYIRLFTNHLKDVETQGNEELIFRCLNVLTDLKKLKG